jgi:hypothetical protein
MMMITKKAITVTHLNFVFYHVQDVKVLSPWKPEASTFTATVAGRRRPAATQDCVGTYIDLFLKRNFIVGGRPVSWRRGHPQLAASLAGGDWSGLAAPSYLDYAHHTRLELIS